MPALGCLAQLPGEDAGTGGAQAALLRRRRGDQQVKPVFLLLLQLQPPEDDAGAGRHCPQRRHCLDRPADRQLVGSQSDAPAAAAPLPRVSRCGSGSRRNRARWASASAQDTALRKHRHGWRRGSGASRHVVETYLYWAIDRDENLVDAMLSAHRDMKAAKALLPLGACDHWLSAGPGDDGRPRVLPQDDPQRAGQDGPAPDQRLLEQDHRGIKGRIRCMRGFKSGDVAPRLQEARQTPRSPPSHYRNNQAVSAALPRFRFARGVRMRVGSCGTRDAASSCEEHSGAWRECRQNHNPQSGAGDTFVELARRFVGACRCRTEPLPDWSTRPRPSPPVSLSRVQAPGKSASPVGSGDER